MSDLKRYTIPDQLDFIDNFINHCNGLFNKINDSKATSSSTPDESCKKPTIDASILNQLLNK